jgi:integrase
MARQILPLSDAKCRAAKYSPQGKNKLFDGGGLYLHLLASGAKKWRLKFNGITGKENLLTFGDYPAVTLTAARAKRDEVRAQLSDGVDPAVKRDADRLQAQHSASSTFKAIAQEWLETKIGGWSAKHEQRIISILEKDTYPHIGQLPMSEVTPASVLGVLRRIEKRGAYEIAAKGLDAMSLICHYAAGTGRAPSDVTQGLRTFLKARPPVKHYPHVTEAELPKLLARIESYSGTPQTKLAIKLMILTFLRTNELRWAEWSEFDMEAKEWRVPAARMKGNKERKESGQDHIVPLAPQTIALLDELKEHTGRYRMLFPGVRNPSTQAMSAETINKALKSLGFEGKQTGHGFRGLASTILNERSGFHADAIERQLAHIETNRVRAAYNHAKHMQERHRLMCWWADFIDVAAGKQRKSMTVVNLR